MQAGGTGGESTPPSFRDTGRHHATRGGLIAWTSKQQPTFRELARQVHIQTWLPEPEQLGLYALLAIKSDNGVAARVIEEKAAACRATSRDSRFRVQVVIQ